MPGDRREIDRVCEGRGCPERRRIDRICPTDVFVSSQKGVDLYLFLSVMYVPVCLLICRIKSPHHTTQLERLEFLYNLEQTLPFVYLGKSVDGNS